MPPKGRGRGVRKNPIKQQCATTGTTLKNVSKDLEISTIKEVNPQFEDSLDVSVKTVELPLKKDLQYKKNSDGDLSSSSSQELHIPDKKERHISESSSSSSDGALAKKMVKLDDEYSTCDSKLKKTKKPGYGTSFRKEIHIITNFFELNTKKQNVFHYDVEILSRNNQGFNKPLSKQLNRLIIFELGKQNKQLDSYAPIFDGKKNLFTAKSLPIKNEEEYIVPVNIDGREKSFSVVIKPVKKKETSTNVINPSSLLNEYMANRLENLPEEMRLVYEAILSHRKQNSSEMKFGMAFFRLQNSIATLGDGLELLQGYSQNIRFTESGATVVINTATAVFHMSGPVTKYISNVLNRQIQHESYLKNNEIERLNKIIRGIRITVTHGKFKRKYYIQQIIRASPRDHKFVVDGKTVSVEDYFKNVYRLTLKYKKLPLLEMRGNKNVCLPMEVCEVLPGQKIDSKFLEGRKKADMIKYAAVPPAKKFDQIRSYANEMSRKSSASMNAYGLNMNLEPISFKTRVLQQPEIKYGSSFTKPNDQGVWNMPNTYLIPAKVKNKWLVINFAQNCMEKDVKNLGQLLCKVSKRVGLHLGLPLIRDFSNESTETALRFAEKQDVDFVVVVISKNDWSHSYGEIKFLCDLKFKLKCQCVQADFISNFRKFNEKAVENICLKINSKLGGVNHTLNKWPLALDKEAVLIIGADVVHSGQLDCSSIAAVVGCTDYEIFKYVVSCRALTNPNQNGKNQEIILTLKDMVKTVLKGYYRNTKKKPQKILFYRDGISEGQFQKALDIEIPQIKDACTELESEYKPPITFVVVQKRIKARFKPEKACDGIGRMMNVPAGTVIDKHIVDPINFDFYLVSHEGIQGTSKPVYYTVLFDENGVQPNVIQELTFDLCHVFARCNRSISIPAPVRYADILAYRAMQYINALKPQQGGKRFSQTSEEVPERIVKLLESIETIQHQMFFV